MRRRCVYTCIFVLYYVYRSKKSRRIKMCLQCLYIAHYITPISIPRIIITAGSGLLTALDKGNKELLEALEALGTLQAIVVPKHPP